MSSSSWIDTDAFPFDAHFLDVDGGRMHYIDEGSGRPVVMIHGNPTWSFLYRDLIRKLRASHRCVAMDHIGFGRSDKPQDWTYRPRDHAQNVTRLIEALGLEGVTLVLHDWGGPMGISYAEAHPQNVRRIVLMNTWMWPVSRSPYYVAFSMLVGGPLGRYLIRRHNFFARVIMPAVYGDASRLTPPIHHHYLAPLERPQDRKGCWKFARAFTGATPWLRELWQQRERLSGVPKLVVWGMKDLGFRPRELRTWEQTYPAAEVVRLEDVGHFVPEEAPQALGAAVAAFLERKRLSDER